MDYDNSLGTGTGTFFRNKLSLTFGINNGNTMCNGRYSFTKKQSIRAASYNSWVFNGNIFITKCHWILPFHRNDNYTCYFHGIIGFFSGNSYKKFRYTKKNACRLYLEQLYIENIAF